MSQKLNINIDAKHSENSVKVLSSYLANTYLLYIKTHGFHWNITGPNFFSLHKLFDEQYNSLFTSIDEIAERIRSLGAYPPTSFSQFIKLSILKEATNIPSAEDMLKQLLSDHEAIICELRSSLELSLDSATEDFIIGQMEAHEKMAWMLRASL